MCVLLNFIYIYIYIYNKELEDVRKETARFKQEEKMLQISKRIENEFFTFSLIIKELVKFHSLEIFLDIRFV